MERGDKSSRWPWTCNAAPVLSGSDHPGLRVDQLLGSSSGGNRGVAAGPGPSWITPGKAETLGKDSFCWKVV